MSSAISGLGGGYSPQVVSGASMRMPPAQKMSQLFQKIDTNNTGSITKAQFESAFQSMNPPSGLKSMGADAIFSKLDPNNTGSVSKQDFVNGMKSILSELRAQQGSSANGSANAGGNTSVTLSSSLQALEATLGSQTAQNTGSTFKAVA
jgi:Ca2+-binding EF-hand superfamily protein